MKTRFAFVVPVYNCARMIRQTIISMAAQSYDNWYMLIRDDMSTDATVDNVRNSILQFDLIDKVRLTINERKHGEVENTLEAAKEIADDDVVVRVDGGDWLADLDALAYLDQVYQLYDPAWVHTAQRWSYNESMNISAPFPDENISPYKHPWVSSHLKTFKRDAMNGINHANYLDKDGKYIQIGCDQAISLPILHKAMLDGRKRLYIPKIFYHYSINLNDSELFTCDRSKKQKSSAEFIRDRGYIG